MIERIQWDGTEAGFEALCAWPHSGQIALSHRPGMYVIVPTKAGLEMLFKNDWLVKDANGELHAKEDR